MVRRKTKQRENIYLAIKNLGHASFEQILNYLKENNLDASLVTLYRNIAFLLEEEKIRIVEISGKAIYETTELNHHYHFSCKDCGQIIDIDKDDIIVYFPHLDHLCDLTIETVDILLQGHCPNCNNKNSIKSEKRKKEN